MVIIINFHYHQVQLLQDKLQIMATFLRDTQVNNNDLFENIL